MPNLIYLWIANARMNKTTFVQGDDLILTVIPKYGDEFYVLFTKLEQGWLWEKMFASVEWLTLKKYYYITGKKLLSIN